MTRQQHASLTCARWRRAQVAVAQAADIVRAVLSLGVDRAMSKFNTTAAAAATTQGSAPKRPRGEAGPKQKGAE